MSETTAERLTRILVDQLGVTADQCKPDTLLVPDHDDMGRQLESHRDHLGCDSLDVVELVMAAEDEFSVEITDDEGEALNEGTFKDCCDLIDRKLAA